MKLPAIMRKTVLFYVLLFFALPVSVYAQESVAADNGTMNKAFLCASPGFSRTAIDFQRKIVLGFTGSGTFLATFDYLPNCAIGGYTMRSKRIVQAKLYFEKFLGSAVNADLFLTGEVGQNILIGFYQTRDHATNMLLTWGIFIGRHTQAADDTMATILSDCSA